MSNDNARHAIVVGAGIVGICCGIELKRRGFAVTVIDRLDPGEACSYGNAGILAAQAVVPIAMPGVIAQVPRMLFDPDSPLVIRLRALPHTLPWLWHFYRAARPEKVRKSADAMKALYGNTVELHEQLAREAGVPELVLNAHYLYVARDPAKANTEKDFAWQLRREHGGEIEVFDGPALREIEPELSPVYNVACVLVPWRDHQSVPADRSYAELLRRQGGTIVHGEVKRCIRPMARRPVETTSGSHQARCRRRRRRRMVAQPAGAARSQAAPHRRARLSHDLRRPRRHAQARQSASSNGTSRSPTWRWACGSPAPRS